MKYLRIFILTTITFIVTANLAFSQTSNPIPKVEKTKTIKVKVKGVGCADDIKSISLNVEKISGVSLCETIKKGATTTFEVTLSPSFVEEKDIFAAIEDTPGCDDPKSRPYKVKQ